jgi:Ca2+-binding EF-hand superfamily protein
MSARVRRAGAPEFAQPGSARSAAGGRGSPLKSPSGFQSPSRLAPIGESRSSPSLGASRTRPRAGRRSTKTLDITGHQKSDHPLGSGASGWNEKPKYRTPSEMWHDRWQTMQPHPSFDVDGDGVISNLDYYLAKQFDRDNNGMLDDEEKVEMRRALTQQGTEAFHAMGHGPQVQSIAAKAHNSLFQPTPRTVDPTQNIDPHSDQWHLQMKHLDNKTKSRVGMSSHVLKKCVEHADTEAGQINVMDEMVGKGVHQMMGSGWKSDQDGHQDVYDADAGGWIDKKAAPKEVRDQDQDFSRNRKGQKVRRSNAILDAYADQEEIEDTAEQRMHEAGDRMMQEEKILHNYDSPSGTSGGGYRDTPQHGRRSSDGGSSKKKRGSMVNSSVSGVQAKAGKLAKPDAKSLRKLFKQLDVDGSGALDREEVKMLAAAGGKTLSERQLADAMVQMDKDGSGEIDYEEFEEWWQHGVANPPKGTEVFRRITNQLETKFSNFRSVFRKFDENHDGTLSQHEFRKGLENCGIALDDREYGELMETLDEDGSNEIDYNEFASSGVVGGKFFAARDPKGFSGEVTKKVRTLLHAAARCCPLLPAARLSCVLLYSHVLHLPAHDAIMNDSSHRSFVPIAGNGG